MVIRKFVFSFFRMIIFIGIFVIVLWLDVGYLIEYLLISNEIVIRIFYLFSNNLVFEDIYYSYDYILIVFNVFIFFFLYIVIMKLVKLIRSK